FLSDFAGAADRRPFPPRLYGGHVVAATARPVTLLYCHDRALPGGGRCRATGPQPAAPRLALVTARHQARLRGRRQRDDLGADRARAASPFRNRRGPGCPAANEAE